MTKRWWLYTGSFLVGITLLIVGFSLANAFLIVVGAGIGLLLFFARGFINKDKDEN